MNFYFKTVSDVSWKLIWKTPQVRPPSSPPEENKLRFVCMADTHSLTSHLKVHLLRDQYKTHTPWYQWFRRPTINEHFQTKSTASNLPFYFIFTRQNYSDILISIQMEVPPGDVFVHAGDFTRCGSVQEVKTSDSSFTSSGSVQEVKVSAWSCMLGSWQQEKSTLCVSPSPMLLRANL